MTACLNSGCQGTQYSLSTRLQEIGELKARLEGSEAQVRELQAALSVKTSSVELSKAEERIRQYQKVDEVQRGSLDRANEEVSYMRQLLRVAKYDMLALEELIGEHLRTTCGRAEAVRLAIV